MAPMHGKVLAILVEPGAAVTKGQRVAMIEAMKMEHSLLAPMPADDYRDRRRGRQQVAEGATIMVVRAAKA